MLQLQDFRPGVRVELHPATDLWMRGARYGEIVGVGRRYLTVLLDATGHRVRISPENIFGITDGW